MYITLETDYAIRITAELCSTDTKLDAKTISERTCVTLRFALKILGKLVNAGIVRSYKGTQGGYVIDRRPEDITLRDVVEAIEGTYQFSRCLSASSECTKGASGCCNFQSAFSDITEVVRKELDKYSFARLIREAQENGQAGEIGESRENVPPLPQIG